MCTVPVPEVVMSASGAYWRKKEMKRFLHFPQSQAERAYSVYRQAGTFSSRIGIILHDCMLVDRSDDIAANRFLACTSIEEEINSPEERTLIS